MKYCLGQWVPGDAGEEAKFLSSAKVARVTGRPGSTNSGATGEWAVGRIVGKQGLSYVQQASIRNAKGAIVRPDGYIPELNMYVEVKSRAYYSTGSSWSEKLDHVARKYAGICGQGKTCVVVFNANQMFERCGRELLSKKDPYVKDFLKLAKRYGVIDWIPITGLSSFLAERQKRSSRSAFARDKRHRGSRASGVPQRWDLITRGMSNGMSRLRRSSRVAGRATQNVHKM